MLPALRHHNTVLGIDSYSGFSGAEIFDDALYKLGVFDRRGP